MLESCQFHSVPFSWQILHLSGPQFNKPERTRYKTFPTKPTVTCTVTCIVLMAAFCIQLCGFPCKLSHMPQCPIRFQVTSGGTLLLWPRLLPGGMAPVKSSPKYGDTSVVTLTSLAPMWIHFHLTKRCNSQKGTLLLLLETLIHTGI